MSSTKIHSTQILDLTGVSVREDGELVKYKTTTLNFIGDLDVIPGSGDNDVDITVIVPDELGKLKDVDLAGTNVPSHGDQLTYNTTLEKWVPGRTSAGYDYSIYLVDPPEHLQKVFRIAIHKNSLLPQNLEGSTFICEIPPQQVAKFRIYKNTTLIGHITFPAGATVGQCTNLLNTEFYVGDIFTLQTEYLPTYEGFSGVGLVLRMRIL